MKINHSPRMFAPAVAALFCVTAAFAGKVDPIYKDGSGVAIRGYNPVAYFTEQKPVKGSEQFRYSWMGATWLFASAANRDQFASNPAQYAPQYGAIVRTRSARGIPLPLIRRLGGSWMASCI
jgi:YHS domain-containing protein